MFEVNDIVKITNPKQIYNYYYDWFIKLGNIELATKYHPFTGGTKYTKYKILAKQPHISTNDMLYAISVLHSNDFLGTKVFLIGEEGLELIKKGNIFKVEDVVTIKNDTYIFPFAETILQHCNLTSSQMGRYMYSNSPINKSIKYQIIGYDPNSNIYAIEEISSLKRVYLIAEEGLSSTEEPFKVGDKVSIKEPYAVTNDRNMDWFKDKDFNVAVRYDYSNTSLLNRGHQYIVYAADNEYCAIAKNSTAPIFLVHKENLKKE